VDKSAPTASGNNDAPPIIVQGRRLSPDERITAQVVDALSNDSRLSGRIGVETSRAVVTLTGRLTDPVQIGWAEDDALGVAHVTDVNTEIRPDRKSVV
jgi:osmotically-inducible protein OsmY